ncbi:IclR family transcriptional regulator [soil metagenome]|uniref:IclR family transcriptional regulator n=1 Tax=Sphingobium sp. BS19 TaxID=3018973 RepID=UPI0022EFA11A|nr:IclR family transcriptional regulator [Sphingobium sp. BS19]GLI99264.1 IclR family transcriptional regulator [Sphingobium sp. BS19]|tara:strand:+ start:650 stop:1426 length:777 start_codon:yes stop_codon:yes gene_type:complete
MRKGTPQIAVVRRSLALLDEVVADQRGLTEIARDLGIPLSTAYRQVATLVAEGYLVRSANGQHTAGHRLLRLLGRVDEKQMIANVAGPALHRLAARVGAIVQLGTLDNEMVTYRIKTGQGAGRLFTKVGMQMEAYCTAIGKVLLAELSERELDAYLSNGPFVPLTERTIVGPQHLREELAKVRGDGYAVDNGEAAERLFCLAVPVRSAVGQIQAAVSVSRSNRLTAKDRADVLELLHETAAEIEYTLAGMEFPARPIN